MAGLREPPDGYTFTHIRWDGGWMEFDCVLRQHIEHEGEVTEHPIDIGADIADHFRLRNIPLILEAEITNTPLALPLTHAGEAQEVRRSNMIEIPAPLFPGAPLSFGGFDISTKRGVQISTLDYTPGLDRINAVYDELSLLQGRLPGGEIIGGPTLLTVSLGRMGDYDNMVLKRFSVNRGPEAQYTMPLTLEFVHVSLVELQTVTITLPKVKKPKKKRSVEKTDGGKKGTGEVVENQSVARRGVVAAAGYVGELFGL